MSGHSKWKTIAHKKGAADAKRGKVFSKISKELMVVARSGGGNPDNNASLRALIQKARESNMPRDNVDRAIKKGTGELESAVLEELVYEGYAPGGVGVIVKALTDNKKRAASDVRHIFTKYGSSFATQGAVSRGFKRKGQILVDAATVEEDKLMGVALDAGADDMVRDGDEFEILTDPASFDAVVTALEKAGIARTDAEVTMIPDAYVTVSDKAAIRSVLKFVEELEDNEDVQDVYTNFNADDAVLAELEKE